MHLQSFEATEKLSILLLIATGLNATITQGPLNSVAEIGKKVKLECTADAPIAYWFLSKNGDTSGGLTIVGPGCSVPHPAFVDHYTVELLDGGKTCNLIVSNITMEQAGVYRCLEGSADSSSILTIIESSPVITVNSTTNIVENENVVIECTLNHNGSVIPAPTLQPHFYWTNSSGQNISSSYDLTTNDAAVSQITVVAGRQNIKEYTCHVYLQLIPAANPNYANNTPAVSSSSSSSAIEVLYTPSMPEKVATSAGLIACEAKDLACYSDANPPPNYSWVDATSGNVTNAQKIIAECGINYTCSASNIIRNAICVNSSTFYEAPITNVTCKFPRVKNMRISGQFCKEDYCKCECNSAIIHCSVDAYPEPLYEWLIPNGSRVQGETVEATMNGIFVCRSYTLIDGLYLMEAYKSINISGCYYSPITTTENALQSNCSSAEIAAIVLGVLLAISIAVNIFSFVLFYRKGAVKKRDSNEPEMTQPSSQSQDPHYQDLSHETLAKPEYEELHR